MNSEQVKKGSENVFADIGFPDAGAHQLKAQIVSEIEDILSNRNLTQAAAGKLMGISQPEVSRLLNGHFREYSIERLMSFLTVFDRDVEIHVRRREPTSGQGKVTFHPIAGAIS